MTPIETASANVGNDSCQWANDLECDDIRFGGTGACREGTDATDCRALAMGGDNSCEWSFDGECDEPRIGVGVCTSGTDTADCAAAAIRRNRTNSCPTSLNDRCDESALGGSGLCQPLTDTSDCLGRTTPAGIRDHHFGFDDRIRVDSSAMPWRTIGQLELDGGGRCTATLVGPDIVLTAAHCFGGRTGRIQGGGRFLAGQSASGSVAVASLVESYVNPQYRDNTIETIGQGNGDDWAFARLNRPIGSEIGYMDVLAPTRADQGQALAGTWFRVNQAGYSWDTGDDISANIGCRVESFFDDNSMFHQCDTTQGDSGSPIFVDRGNGQYSVIAVDSQFFRLPGQTRTSYLAVDARAFAEPLAAYAAGGFSGGTGSKLDEE
ncbi:MAG: trypsin-like serine protease [Pseudomonadota bacterium]